MGKVKAVWQAEQEQVQNNMDSPKRGGLNNGNYNNNYNDPYNLWDDDGGEAELNNLDLGALMAKWEKM